MDLLFDRRIEFIGIPEVIRLIAKTYHFFRELGAAFSALCPNLGKSYVNSKFLALCFHQIEFLLGIRRECIYGYDARKSIDILDIAYMLKQIWKSGFQRL